MQCATQQSVAVAHLHVSCGWCGSGLSNRGEQRPVGRGIQRGQRSRWQWFPKAAALPWQEASNETRVSWHTTFPEKSSVLYLLQPRSAERGCSVWEQTLSGDCGTGGFWRATAQKFWICHPAKSACSGVGGAAKWRGAAKRSLGMEPHHRGRKRYIKLPSRRSGVLCFALASLNTECTCMEKRNPRNTTRAAPAWRYPMLGFPISWRCPS